MSAMLTSTGTPGRTGKGEWPYIPMSSRRTNQGHQITTASTGAGIVGMWHALLRSRTEKASGCHTLNLTFPAPRQSYKGQA